MDKGRQQALLLGLVAVIALTAKQTSTITKPLYLERNRQLFANTSSIRHRFE